MCFTDAPHVFAGGPSRGSHLDMAEVFIWCSFVGETLGKRVAIETLVLRPVTLRTHACRGACGALLPLQTLLIQERHG